LDFGTSQSSLLFSVILLPGGALITKIVYFILAWEAFWRNPKDLIPCCHPSSGLLTGPLYEEAERVP